MSCRSDDCAAPVGVGLVVEGLHETGTQPARLAVELVGPERVTGDEHHGIGLARETQCELDAGDARSDHGNGGS